MVTFDAILIELLRGAVLMGLAEDGHCPFCR